MLKKAGCKTQSRNDTKCAYTQRGTKLSEPSSKMLQPGVSCQREGSAKQPDSNKAQVHSFFRYLNIRARPVC